MAWCPLSTTGDVAVVVVVVVTIDVFGGDAGDGGDVGSGPSFLGRLHLWLFLASSRLL